MKMKNGMRPVHPGEVLREDNALRAEEDDVRRAKTCLDLAYARHDRLWLHDHTGSPTVRGIVRDAVAVRCKIAQVMHMDLQETPLLGSLQDTGLERRRKHLGKERKNMDVHGLIK